MAYLHGFIDELQKLSGHVKTADLLSALGGKLGANAIAHAIINTKMSPAFLRKAIEHGGDEAMAAGFRHAITGRRIRGLTQAALGTAISPSVPYTYNMGYKFGKKVADSIEKIPLVPAKAPFKALELADRGVTGSIKAAPVAGVVGGGGYGYLTGKTKKEKVPIKSILAGALTGGLLGHGVKGVAPKAPPVSQLKWVRERVVDPVLAKKQSRLARVFDAMAVPTKK